MMATQQYVPGGYTPPPPVGEYALATGPAAVRRLHLLHNIYSPVGRRVLLKPGGIALVEDGDLATAGSQPPTALNAFADLFTRLGPTRGLNYSMARNLYHLVASAGFRDPEIEIHQPALSRGKERLILKWSM